MSTFAEITYMCIDELKLYSGDSDYTIDHILFIADKLRAYLLEKKYQKAMGALSSENFQEICYDLELIHNIDGIPCSEPLLRSTKEIPDILQYTILNVSPNTVLQSSIINMVPFERLPYVGKTHWTSNLIFASRGRDNHLYLKSSNPQFLYLKKVRTYGVFSDTRKAIEAGCNGKCDIMEQRYPLEESLVTLLIQSVVQELSGQRYMPKDKQNNAADDMAGQASATPRNINRQYVQN